MKKFTPVLLVLFVFVPHAFADTSTEPGYNPTTDHLVMQDNMDEYTDVVSMGALPIGSVPRVAPEPSPSVNGQPVDPAKNQLITPGHGGTGTALRLSYPVSPGGIQNSEVYGAGNVPAAPNSATHFFQYWARVTVAGSLAVNHQVISVKWFEAWHFTAGRMQWNTHDHGPCPSIHTDWTYWQVYDQGGETTCQGDQPVGPYFNQDIANGEWHRFTYEYRPNSVTGARDGIARMWIDGQKIIDISASSVGVTPPGGTWPWSNMDDLDGLSTQGIDHVNWGSVQTSTSPPWTLDIDDFTWWTGTDASPYVPPPITPPANPAPPVIPPPSDNGGTILTSPIVTPSTPDTTASVTPPPVDPLAAVIALILDNRPLFEKATSLGITLPPLIQKVLDTGSLTQADLDGTTSVQLTTPTKTTTAVTSTQTSHTNLSLSSITRPLKLTYIGTDVILLQNFLIQTNAGPQAKLLATHGANGSFGPLTQAALMEYQKSVGIPGTGILDSATKSRGR